MIPFEAKALRGQAMDFARLVISLLKEDGFSRKQTIFSGPEAGSDYSGFDAVAPDGFGDLPGPCICEVKTSIPTAAVSLLIQRLIQLQNKIKFGSILLVTDFSVDEINSIKKKMPNITIPFHVWGQDDIDKLANVYPEIALAYDPSLFRSALKSYKEKTDRIDLTLHYEVLREALSKKRLVLFLGAGVSKSIGLPDWPELIERLTVKLISKDKPSKENVVKSYLNLINNKNPNSPLIMARIIHDNMLRTSLTNDNIDDFHLNVRDALYEKVFKEDGSPLLEAIVKLCKCNYTKRPGIAISSVVTYNFDNIFEADLRKNGIAHRVIFDEKDIPDPDELTIYHPHGYLPKGEELNERHKMSLVLSEEAYHRQFIDMYSWVNIKQIDLIRNYTCLFVGFSMTDPNLRRLLEVSQLKFPGPRHYAIIHDRWKPSIGDSDLFEIGINFRCFEEASLRRLGVTVLWADDYKQIPEMLNETINTGR